MFCLGDNDDPDGVFHVNVCNPSTVVPGVFFFFNNYTWILKPPKFLYQFLTSSTSDLRTGTTLLDSLIRFPRMYRMCSISALFLEFLWLDSI